MTCIVVAMGSDGENPHPAPGVLYWMNVSTARRGGEDTLEPALQGFIKVCRVSTGLDEVHGRVGYSGVREGF